MGKKSCTRDGKCSRDDGDGGRVCGADETAVERGMMLMIQ